MTLSETRMSLCENRLCIYLLLLFFITTNNSIYAEGTKELSPNPTDRVFLYLNGDLYNNFGRYDGSTDQRLYFHVANPNQEQVLLGFSQAVSSGHYPCSGAYTNAYFRIKDPNGNIVFPTPGNPSGQLLDENTANITSRNQAIAGPNSIGGASGYEPFVFDPVGLPAGDYYIEFSGLEAAPSNGLITAIEHWDITVASKEPAPQAKLGRVFAINWSFYAPSRSCGLDDNYSWFDRPFNGNIFVLSKEGFVNKVDFQGAGFQPAAFNLFFNETGTNNTGNPYTDRMSSVGLGTGLALQKIFLNDPDINVYPSGEYGTLNVPPELHVCGTTTDACILIEATKEGQIEVLIDLEKNNGDFIYNAETKDVLIVFSIVPESNEVAPYTRCIPWDGRDGFGAIIPENTSVDLSVTYQQGVYHLPVFDVEYSLNGFSTTNIRPARPSGNLENKLYYDDTNIPYDPMDNSSKTALNGCSSPCHTWSNRDYGNQNTINTWFFADEETRLRDEQPKCLITAINDTTYTLFGTSTTIPVLNNDFGDILDTNSVAISIPPDQGGTITNVENGVIAYMPEEGFIGIDSFQYLVCYNFIPRNTLCDLATVFVNIGSPNETDCQDGIDNDNDGLIDCDDNDCLPTRPNSIQRKSGEE